MRGAWPPRLHRLSDAVTLCDAVAGAFVERATEAIATRGRFAVALAGGSTPRPVYERLAAAPYRDALDWSCVELFFGDERCVPPDDARSNYRMARETLIDAVAVPPECVHRMRGEDEPHAAARQYVGELHRVFGDGWPPRLDLILLGLGANGHTASLFPGTGVLRERTQAVCAQYVEVQQQWRLTLTLPVLNAARAVWVLAAGKGKAEIVQRVLSGPRQPDVLPIQRVVPPDGEYLWWLDAAAGALVRSES